MHLPQQLNKYKWLRGQNHYDSFLLSGVSGHGVAAFYYPEKAEANCNGCHMKPVPSNDFGAKYHDGKTLAIRDHLFPSANTAIAKLAGRAGLARRSSKEHETFNEGVVRVDLFGVKEGGTIDGPLDGAPAAAACRRSSPGRSYLLETVVRTVKLGHHFTQGTADSNEVWLEVTATAGDRRIGKSGGRAPSGEVDPWSHFLNAWVLDREGRRIDRRNAQDIFVPLYDHQIGPGAADVIHYRLNVPPDLRGALTVEVALRYRKFDTKYMRHGLWRRVRERPAGHDPGDRPHHFPACSAIGKCSGAGEPGVAAIPEWQRWNDYGIGLLQKGGKTRGELAGAEAAFAEVERLGQARRPAQSGAGLPRAGRGRRSRGRGARARGEVRSSGTPLDARLARRRRSTSRTATSTRRSPALEGILPRPAASWPSGASTSRATTGCASSSARRSPSGRGRSAARSHGRGA